ncbi:MAG: hypothetical protein HY892_01725 [Deltaproteobacteria bacterium]|nr:hypothetical protein [Deltaproteobacteria bacterium]
MIKLKSTIITALAVTLLTGFLSGNCLAQPCYLPIIIKNLGPVITPVTPQLVVGSWVMTDVKTGISDFFLHTAPEGSLAINDFPNDNPHIFGTWSIVADTFEGPFENPGVGTGVLVGTIVDGVFTLDFIEFWHDPPKHIFYKASRL